MLTVTKVNQAKPKGKAYKLADQRGLYLIVTPAGGKLWRWKYRIHGLEKLMALGNYPDVSLAKVRERHQQARTLFGDGRDPMAERRLEKQAQRQRVEHTFRAVALRWHNHWKQGQTPRHAAYVLSRLERDILPRLGTRPVQEITALEVRSTLQSISDRGVTDLAKRAHQVVAQVFRFAISHEITQNNPAASFRPSDILPSTKKKNYARVSSKELPHLLQAIHLYTSLPTRLAMEFLALTFVRTSELLGMKWEEIDWDENRWNIPGSRMKMKTPHIVPLSTQALAILEQIRPLNARGEYVFPGLSGNKPMSNNTILKALGRMGYKGRMTGHGFRGVASTLLHEQGFDHEHIELQLAHQQRNQVAASYNHAQHLKSRATMMQYWADYLEQQREKKQTVQAVA